MTGVYVGLFALMVIGGTLKAVDLWWQAKRRQAGALEAAAQLGMEALDRPLKVADLELWSLKSMKGITAKNAVTGEPRGGGAIYVFEYAMAVNAARDDGVGGGAVTRDREGSWDIERRSGGLIATALNAPELVIRPRRTGPGVDSLGTESEAFDRLYEVRTDDRRFATAVLSPHVMELLLGIRPEAAFELKSEWIFCSTQLLPLDRLHRIVDLLVDFRDQLDPTVYELWPASH